MVKCIYILMIRFDQNKIRFERSEMTVRLFPDSRDMLFHFYSPILLVNIQFIIYFLKLYVCFDF